MPARLQSRSRTILIFATLSLLICPLVESQSNPVQAHPSDFITRVAGTGYAGSNGDGGRALQAQLISPSSVAVDKAGNIYIADSTAEVVRKVTVHTGIISTYAGTGVGGYSGDSGPAAEAKLNEPLGLAFDNEGNLYIADHSNDVIRQVNAQTGIITTVVGNGQGAGAPALFLGDCLYPRQDNVLATQTPLCSPYFMAFDTNDNLYFTDFNYNVIRRVDAKSRIITTIAGTGTITYPTGPGNYGYDGDGGPAIDAQLGYPIDLAFDAAGNLYFSDVLNCAIRKVDAQTQIITSILGELNPSGYFGVCGLSGDGGRASSAVIGEFGGGLRIDAANNLYLSDTDNFLIRRIDLNTGLIDTVAGSYTSYGPLSNYATPGFRGDNGPATYALLDDPEGIALTPTGDLLIADSYNHVVRKVTAPAVLAVITPVISLVSGVVSLPAYIVINDANPAATIYYTLNGDPPTTFSTRYTDPIYIPDSTLLTAFATIPGSLNSRATIAPYFNLPAPIITPASGNPATPFKVTISDANPKAKIYYTTNNIDPDPPFAGTLYTGPFKLPTTSSVEVVAIATLSLKTAQGQVFSGASPDSYVPYVNPAQQPPVVVNVSAIDISSSSAIATGLVTADDATTTVSVSWGASPTALNSYYYSATAVTGTQPTTVYANITGLQPNTTYYFTFHANNGIGYTTASNILSFTTP